jgi:hypothetical protein
MGLCERPLLNNTSMLFYCTVRDVYNIIYTQSGRNISFRFSDGKSKLAIKPDIKVQFYHVYISTNNNIQVFGASMLWSIYTRCYKLHITLVGVPEFKHQQSSNFSSSAELSFWLFIPMEPIESPIT